jgi:hypothetical protein
VPDPSLRRGVLAAATCALLVLLGGCGSSSKDELDRNIGAQSSDLAGTPKAAALDVDQSLRHEGVSRFTCWREKEGNILLLDLPKDVSAPTAIARREGALWLVEVTHSNGLDITSTTYEVRQQTSGYCVSGAR